LEPLALKNEDETIFTTIDQQGKSQLKCNRPILLISSTSWTMDEDFNLLLDAVDQIEVYLGSTPGDSFPDVVIIITGKGPLESGFMAQVRSRAWKKVTIISKWFHYDDYPILLGIFSEGWSCFIH